jgi:hypothetical protein
MLRIIREFSVGRPQLIAGAMLLAFLAQCLWVASGRRLSDLEYEYIASGHRPQRSLQPRQEFRITSPFIVRNVVPARISAALAVPRPWLLRLPFVIFGFWLGAALWWVARRLFGDEGGYCALALYCFSPAMVMISSIIGPEIILAWSSFGLIYTAIGVAHTVYSPPSKWAPRIVLLGLSIGISISVSLWAGTLVLLALAFILYLTPGRRRSALIVFACASVLGAGILGIVAWITGSAGAGSRALLTPQFSVEAVRSLGFPLNKDTDSSYVLVALFIVALTAYGSWKRARYFGNTAPLLTALIAVFLFAVLPAAHLWPAALGLSFLFLFVAGVAADLLETSWRRWFLWIFFTAAVIRIVEGCLRLAGWIHEKPL